MARLGEEDIGFVDERVGGFDVFDATVEVGGVNLDTIRDETTVDCGTTGRARMKLSCQRPVPRLRR